MKKILVLIYSLVISCSLSAQEREKKDLSAMLENRIWKIQSPENKSNAIEMEFRDALWTSIFSHDGLREETKYSYTLCGDTIKVFESRQEYRILALTNSKLTIQYLPKSLTKGDGPIKYVTDNSLSGLRKNENRLDSIWRKEKIWNLGFSRTDRKNQEATEPPRWPRWDYDLERYFVLRMKYPTQLLAKNKAGYSVAMFSIDTLGLPCDINILTTTHKDFDKEVVRLIKALPHCLPCRDENGKRIRCLYTVYVPFLPQHYRDRVKAERKAESISKKELKNSFSEWEEHAKFQDGNPLTLINYIHDRLTYDPKLLGEVKQVRGLYSASINSYGEVTESKTLRSCGIQALDNQVEQIIKNMPHWIPAIDYRKKAEYQSTHWTIPVLFNNRSNQPSSL